MTRKWPQGRFSITLLSIGLLLACEAKVTEESPPPTDRFSGIPVVGFGRLGPALTAPQPPSLPKPELPTRRPFSEWTDEDVEGLLTLEGFAPRQGDLYTTFILKTRRGVRTAELARGFAGNAASLVSVFPHLAFYDEQIWEGQRQWLKHGERTNVGILSSQERNARAQRLESGGDVSLPMRLRPLFPGARERGHPDLETDTYWVVSLPVYERELDAIYGDALSTLVNIGFNLQADLKLARVAPRLPTEIALQSSFNLFTRGECVTDGGEPEGVEPIEGGADWVRERLGVPDPNVVSGEGIRVAHLDVGWGVHPELNFDDPNDTDANASFDWEFERDFPDGDNDAQVDPLDPGLIFAGHGISTGSQIVSAPGDELTGIAPGAILIPIRAVNNVILDPFGGVPVAEAIWWATHDAGAEVITMSIGGVGNSWMELAIADAVYNNVIVVAAAGNVLPNLVAPALTPECVAAAGSTVEDRPWDGSARNAELVTIAAPATDVFSARFDPVDDAPKVCRVPNDGGTSNSTAIVSSAAALWLGSFGRQQLIEELQAKDSEGTLQEIFMQRLRATATVPDDWDPDFGPGILHIGRLLGEDRQEMIDEFQREPWNTFERRAYLASIAADWGKDIDWSGLDLVPAAAVMQNLQNVDTLSRRSAARGQTEVSYRIEKAVGGFFAGLAEASADIEEGAEEQVEEFQEQAESLAEEVIETIGEIAKDAEDSAEELAEDGCEMVNTFLGMVGADTADCST